MYLDRTKHTKGHIGFSELDGQAYEWVEKDDGQVYRCSMSNVVDVVTGYRQGRWECSREHFDRYRNEVYSFVQ